MPSEYEEISRRMVFFAEYATHQEQIIFARSQLECGLQGGKSMLIREGYGSEYFKNSISNDRPLLTSGVPATNRPLAFATMKSNTFSGQGNRSIDSRSNLTHFHCLRRCMTRNLMVSVHVDMHIEVCVVIKGFLVSCSPLHWGQGHVPVHKALVSDYKKCQAKLASFQCPYTHPGKTHMLALMAIAACMQSAG